MFKDVNWTDVGERSVATFVQTFAAVAIANGTIGLETIESALVAGVAAVLSVWKNVASRYTKPGSKSKK